jgi:hypothetical protein
MTPRLILSHLSLGLAALLLCSCSTSKLKPKPAKLSPFLSSTVPLEATRKTGPFALAGGTPKTTAKSLYVAPIALAHLRGPTKWLSKNGDAARRLAEAEKVAAYGQAQFANAFIKASPAVYAIDTTPQPQGATLELAITELNRNTIVGTVGRVASRVSGVPGLAPALALSGLTRPLKADIAIEGKLVENRTGRIVYQFADVAESKLSLLPITDFAAYGQARQAMRDWARVFEKVTRAAPHERVRAPRWISLY